jgi:hypothetical protein
MTGFNKTPTLGEPPGRVATMLEERQCAVSRPKMYFETTSNILPNSAANSFLKLGEHLLRVW